MAFYHRKLMLDYNNTSTLNSTLFCTLLCDPNKSPSNVDCCSYCSPPPTQPPPPPIYHHPKISLPLKIFLIVLVITFSLFLLYTLYKFYTVWHRSRQQQRPQSEPDQEAHDDFLDQDIHRPVVDHPIWYIRTVGLQPSVISAITIVRYKKGEGLVEGTDCSVCLSEFQEDETLRLLPKCNHAFHIPCIDTWLRSHTNCPLCRAGIVKNTANSPSPEQVFVENSGPTGETQVGNSEGDGGLERESEEHEVSEVRIGIEEDDDVSIPKAEVGNIELVLMRRSVSLDSSAASRISAAVNAAIANNSDAVDQSDDTQMVKLDQTDLGVARKRVDENQNFLRSVGSSSIGRSLQKRPYFMRRSFSCSGKVLWSRHSSRENSVPPPS